MKSIVSSSMVYSRSDVNRSKQTEPSYICRGHWIKDFTLMNNVYHRRCPWSLSLVIACSFAQGLCNADYIKCTTIEMLMYMLLLQVFWQELSSCIKCKLNLAKWWLQTILIWKFLHYEFMIHHQSVSQIWSLRCLEYC